MSNPPNWRPANAVKPGPGQESVWDYPRPPRVEAVDVLVRVEYAGSVLAETRRALRVLETSHPPTYYLPPDDVRLDFLRLTGRRSYCEWKGQARYWTIECNGRSAPYAAWSYPDPTPAFAALRDCLAFYPGRMDACYVGGARVVAQAGDFYGGWITPDIVGPFKGEPGTTFW